MAPPEERYASPLELLLSPDGTRLYVLCQGADEVRVLNSVSGAVLQTIPVGHVPRGFSLSPDARRLLVANSWDDTVTVIDTQKGRVMATWGTGFEPSSVVEDRAGKLLYVADRISNDVMVLDATTGEKKSTLTAGRGACYMTMAPDGSQLYVTHVYPNPTAYRTPPRSEITVIDEPFTGNDAWFMTTGYRLPDNECGCIAPGTTAPKTRPITNLKVRSFVTSLANNAVVKVGRPTMVKGIAFDGGSGIKKVEASIDGGRTWRESTLGANLGRYSFRECTVSITPEEPGPFGLLARATAVSGETQPGEATWNPAGYARNVIESLNIVAA